MSCGHTNPIAADTTCRRPTGHTRWHKGRNRRGTWFVWCTGSDGHITQYATATARRIMAAPVWAMP